MDTSLTAALGMGFLLGLRHAMDADHLAAMSTFVSRHRGLLRSCVLGTVWGAGHTVALLAAGIATVGFKLTISPAVEHGLEMAVAGVLILLGGHLLLKTLADAARHPDDHTHGGVVHRHAHDRAHLLAGGRRPFLMGLLHGLAGSAALTLLVLGSIPSAAGGLLYILVFGIGSTAGMLVLSGVIGLPFAVLGTSWSLVHTVVRALAGAASVGVGALVAWDLG